MTKGAKTDHCMDIKLSGGCQALQNKGGIHLN